MKDMTMNRGASWIKAWISHCLRFIGCSVIGITGELQ